MSIPQPLTKLAAAKGLKVVDLGSGHYQITGGSALVNYWPHSKRRTAYVDGERSGKSGVTPQQAVEMAGQAKPQTRPVVRHSSSVFVPPSKRTPADWIARIPHLWYAWRKKEREAKHEPV